MTFKKSLPTQTWFYEQDLPRPEALEWKAIILRLNPSHPLCSRQIKSKWRIKSHLLTEFFWLIRRNSDKKPKFCLNRKLLHPLILLMLKHFPAWAAALLAPSCPAQHLTRYYPSGTLCPEWSYPLHNPLTRASSWTRYHVEEKMVLPISPTLSYQHRSGGSVCHQEVPGKMQSPSSSAVPAPSSSARDYTAEEVMSLRSLGERAPLLVTPPSQEADPSSCALARPAAGACWQKRGQERRKSER